MIFYGEEKMTSYRILEQESIQYGYGPQDWSHLSNNNDNDMRELPP